MRARRPRRAASTGGSGSCSTRPASVAKFGVPPASIPDCLALVGDTSDGYPGHRRAGAPKSGGRRARALPAARGHPGRLRRQWDVTVRGAAALGRAACASSRAGRGALTARWPRCARTCRCPRALDDLRWRGARRDELRALCARDRRGPRSFPGCRWRGARLDARSASLASRAALAAVAFLLVLAVLRWSPVYAPCRRSTCARCRWPRWACRSPWSPRSTGGPRRSRGCVRSRWPSRRRWRAARDRGGRCVRPAALPVRASGPAGELATAAARGRSRSHGPAPARGALPAVRKWTFEWEGELRVPATGTYRLWADGTRGRARRARRTSRPRRGRRDACAPAPTSRCGAGAHRPARSCSRAPGPVRGCAWDGRGRTAAATRAVSTRRSRRGCWARRAGRGGLGAHRPARARGRGAPRPRSCGACPGTGRRAGALTDAGHGRAR